MEVLSDLTCDRHDLMVVEMLLNVVVVAVVVVEEEVEDENGDSY